MSDTEQLIFDLVEWIARSPRRHAEVMEAWRTSCPRLTIWEDAIERGLVERTSSDYGAIVTVTARGRHFLKQWAAASAAVRASPR